MHGGMIDGMIGEWMGGREDDGKTDGMIGGWMRWWVNDVGWDDGKMDGRTGW